MPNYLIILITILVCIAIVACIYLIITFRKMHIVTKKLDYLVEDLTYKSEQLTSVVDSMVKIGDFVDVIESTLKKRTQEQIKQTTGSKESIYKVATELKEIISKKNDKKGKK